MLIKKASVDAPFHQVLLDRRAEAAREIDLELLPVEAALLNAAPRALLAKIIEKTTGPDDYRQIFLGQHGASMVTLLTIGLPSDDLIIQGIRADVIESRSTSGAYIDADIRTLEEQPNSVTVIVSYGCPFETGQIIIVLDYSNNPRAPDLTYLPAQSVTVSAGSGEVAFTINGTGGTTHFVLVGLSNTTESCRRASDQLPMSISEIRRHTSSEGAAWKTIQYCQVWLEE